jgi:hypothetical protein
MIATLVCSFMRLKMKWQEIQDLPIPDSLAKAQAPFGT